MIYFDHNASTPVRREAREAMTEALAGSGANPSSAHREGQRARAAVERARAHAAGLAVQCDAVQAAGKIPVDFGALGVDALVISAHKLGGPKGIGALILRDGTPCEPLFRGSAHESGRRGGTENLPGIVGFGVAAECAARELAVESARLL